MAITTFLVFTIELLSLLAMVIVLLFFRRMQHKQKELFLSLQNGEALMPQHRVLVALYIFSTLGIGAISLWLFLFQPHLL